MSCLFPQAPNLSAYWTNIVNGVDSTRPATDEEWGPEKFYNPEPTSFEQIYCKRGGFITELADFDPLRFGVMPNSIQGSRSGINCLLSVWRVKPWQTLVMTAAGTESTTLK